MPDLYLSWQFDPVLIGGLVTLAVLYGLAAGPLRKRLAPAGTPFPRWRALAFYGALALFYLFEGSPLHDLADLYSLTAHMVQHLGVSYLVAPLVLWAVPTWLWRALLLNRVVAPVARIALNPVVAFATFGITFSIWHVPAVYDAIIRDETLHHVSHLAFLALSLQMWWPVASRLPELPRLPHLGALVYLFLQPVAQLPVFGIITFAGQPIYETYANSPWTLGMDVVSEQALAGAVMKVFGFVVFGIRFAQLFYAWFQEENAPRAARERAAHQAGLDATAAAAGR